MPAVDVGLMFLAMKNRPAFVTWFLFANVGLTYDIQIPKKLSAPTAKSYCCGCCHSVDFIRFFDYNILDANERLSPGRFL